MFKIWLSEGFCCCSCRHTDDSQSTRILARTAWPISQAFSVVAVAVVPKSWLAKGRYYSGHRPCQGVISWWLRWSHRRWNKATVAYSKWTCPILSVGLCSNANAININKHLCCATGWKSSSSAGRSLLPHAVFQREAKSTGSIANFQ